MAWTWRLAIAKAEYVWSSSVESGTADLAKYEAPFYTRPLEMADSRSTIMRRLTYAP